MAFVYLTSGSGTRIGRDKTALDYARLARVCRGDRDETCQPPLGEGSGPGMRREARSLRVCRYPRKTSKPRPSSIMPHVAGKGVDATRAAADVVSEPV